MARSSTNRLKVFRDEVSADAKADSGLECLDVLCRAFEQATRWPLRWAAGPSPGASFDVLWSAPASPGDGTAPGQLAIERRAPEHDKRRAGLPLEQVVPLAQSLADLLCELGRTRGALRRREAELALASDVPRVEQLPAQPSLDLRLEAVLRGGAKSLDCHAAALYLLDEETTHLKLRANWGLSSLRYAEPPRPLAGALGDLEALCGHAVVLEQPALARQWAMPEEGFQAAICVPVSGSSMPLGTLWLFCQQSRAFTDSHSNLAEILAGRIAAELEREVMRAGLRQQPAARFAAPASRRRWDAVPAYSPLVDGWDVAGWVAEGNAADRVYCDWFSAPDDSLAVALGQTPRQSLGSSNPAARSATEVLRAVVRSHGGYHDDTSALARQTHRTLWSLSAGEASADLFFAFVDPLAGRIRYSAAGNLGAVLVRGRKWESLAVVEPPLGGPETCRAEQHQRVLAPGETLLVYSPALVELLATGAQCNQAQPLVRALFAADTTGHTPAAAQVDALRRALGDALPTEAGPLGLLVLRYRG